MIRYAPLKTLPAGTRFPQDLQARVTYDSASGRLGFESFMCKADFDRLYGLSSDRDYRLAVEELFRICTYDAEEPTRGSSLPRLTYAVGLAVTALAMTAATVWWWLASQS